MDSEAVKKRRREREEKVKRGRRIGVQAHFSRHFFVGVLKINMRNYRLRGCMRQLGVLVLREPFGLLPSDGEHRVLLVLERYRRRDK